MDTHILCSGRQVRKRTRRSRRVKRSRGSRCVRTRHTCRLTAHTLGVTLWPTIRRSLRCSNDRHQLLVPHSPHGCCTKQMIRDNYHYQAEKTQDRTLWTCYEKIQSWSWVRFNVPPKTLQVISEPRQIMSPPITHGGSSSLSPLSSCLTRSFFHSELKTWLFGKSFPP